MGIQASQSWNVKSLISIKIQEIMPCVLNTFNSMDYIIPKYKHLINQITKYSFNLTFHVRKYYVYVLPDEKANTMDLHNFLFF